MRHLIRGVVGVVALVAALYLAKTSLLALLLLPIALIAFRGCPTCWIVSLVDHLRGRAPSCGRGVGGC